MVLFGFFLINFIQRCFICLPSDSTKSEDAKIEPRTVAIPALAVRRSNYLARFHPQLGYNLSTTRLDLIHIRLDLINFFFYQKKLDLFFSCKTIQFLVRYQNSGSGSVLTEIAGSRSGSGSALKPVCIHNIASSHPYRIAKMRFSSKNGWQKFRCREKGRRHLR